MITVLRRWFVPSDKLEELTERWRTEVLPEIRRQPGCVPVEVYESKHSGALGDGDNLGERGIEIEGTLEKLSECLCSIRTL